MVLLNGTSMAWRGKERRSKKIVKRNIFFIIVSRSFYPFLFLRTKTIINIPIATTTHFIVFPSYLQKAYVKYS